MPDPDMQGCILIARIDKNWNSLIPLQIGEVKFLSLYLHFRVMEL